jgi:hypothetical protein
MLLAVVLRYTGSACIQQSNFAIYCSASAAV